MYVTLATIHVQLVMDIWLISVSLVIPGLFSKMGIVWFRVLVDSLQQRQMDNVKLLKRAQFLIVLSNLNAQQVQAFV